LIFGKERFKYSINHLIMAVKHTPTGKVHKGSKGETTGCGFNTNEQPTHWENTTASINCDKDGCKN
jgi:hypothetical protein